MRHLNKKVTLDRARGPREALLKNLVMATILYEKIKTTRAKAKAAEPIVNKMINLGKKNTLAAKRQLYSYFPIENPVKKIVEDLAKRYADRSGGFTRITKLGVRKGDAAEVVRLELL